MKSFSALTVFCIVSSSLPLLAQASQGCKPGYSPGGGYSMECKDKFNLAVSFGVTDCVKDSDYNVTEEVVSDDGVYLSMVTEKYKDADSGGLAKLIGYDGTLNGSDSFTVSWSDRRTAQLYLTVAPSPGQTGCYHGSLTLENITRLDNGQDLQDRHDAPVVCITTQDEIRIADFAGCQ